MSEPLRHLLHPCFAGMKRNLVPGLVLQALALSVLLLFALSKPFATWLEGIGRLKVEYGFGFSAVSTAFFGGLLPYSVLLATGRLEPRRRGSILLFYLGFWIWKGVEVDALYRGQAIWFGDTASFVVILKKTLVDQLIYCSLWAAPTQTIFFLWKDAGFSWAGLKARLREESLGHRTIVVLVSSWVVWIPTVAIVYSLPAPLQIPLFNLVICFWSLLMTSLSQGAGRERKEG